MSWPVRWAVLLAIVVSAGWALITTSSSARAAFPGRPGLIAFERIQNGTISIHEITPAGRMIGRITQRRPGTDDVDPVWTADGKTLAIASSGRGGTFQINIIDGSGASGRTQLTSGAANKYQPSWDPPGRSIAYTSGPPTGSSGGKVGLSFLQRPKGVRRWLATTTGALNPVWSPDGRTIAIQRTVNGNTDLYLIRGNETTRLTTAPEADIDPDWSPDGTRLAFVRYSGTNQDVYVLVVERPESARRLTRSTGQDFGPVWSPDARRIAFVSDRGGWPQIYVMNANGSGQTNISRSPFSDLDPDWQPVATTPAFAPISTPDGGGRASATCEIEGTPGDDNLRGTPSADVICGYGGKDTIDGRGGNDRIFGHDGNDVLRGGPGNDEIISGSGRDRVYGGRGDDKIKANDGLLDTLDGGQGKDSDLADPTEASVLSIEHPGT